MWAFKGKQTYTDPKEVAAKIRDGVCLLCGGELDFEYCCKAESCGKDWLKLACRLGLVKDSDKDLVKAPEVEIWTPGSGGRR